MARQVIDTTTNNGTYIGDPAKIAFTKVNDMTQELYSNKVSLGEYGVYGVSPPVVSDVNASSQFKFVTQVTPATLNLPRSLYGLMLMRSTNGTSLVPAANVTVFQEIFDVSTNDVFQRRSLNGGPWSVWSMVWNSANTTVDANNFIKRA